MQVLVCVWVINLHLQRYAIVYFVGQFVWPSCATYIFTFDAFGGDDDEDSEGDEGDEDDEGEDENVGRVSPKACQQL